MRRLLLLVAGTLALASCETEYSYTAVAADRVDIHEVVECAFDETDAGWEQYSCAPVFSARDRDAQPWEQFGIGNFDIVQREIFGAPVYQMFYSGLSGTAASNGREIGYAVSMDGVTWTRHPWNPVLRRGTNPGSFDRDDAQVACVAFDGDAGVFHLWYTGTNGTGVGTTFGHATSPDGVFWDKDLLNPLDPFGGTTSPLSRVWGCDALYEDGAFHFYVGGLNYAPGDIQNATYDIAYLSTTDGANFDGNGDLVLEHSGEPGTYDAEGVHRPSVFTFDEGEGEGDEDVYWMMYAGYSVVNASQPSPGGLISFSTEGERLGMASSATPGAGWSKLGDEAVPLLFGDVATADNPRAVFINGRVHVFFTDTFHDPIDGTPFSGIGLGISPFPVEEEAL